MEERRESTPGTQFDSPADTRRDSPFALLDTSPNAILATDLEGRIRYMNPKVETTFGYTRDELLGEPVEILVPLGAVHRHARRREGFHTHPAARAAGIGLDLTGRRKDGTEFPAEISLAPVETADGPQVLATVIDITARKAIENQLLQAQKLESVGRLAGGIAHDFNNVLFAIKGYAELLAEDLSPDRRSSLDADEALRNVHAITVAATRAATLTAQLLAFSRQQVVHPEVLELNAAIEAVEPMLRPLIGEQIRLAVRLGPETGRVRMAKGQLDQILVNLVINARDAMPDGGTITIESGNLELDAAYVSQHLDVRPGPYVYLAVSDTGEGMDAETRDHAFEPFYTTKAQGKGTGLGLATIYGIMQQAGGHVWLYSEPGTGSSFKLYFPRVDAPVPGPHAAHVARANDAGGTLLVVEDERSVREMTTMVLRRAGYDVHAVADGTEAMRRLGELDAPIDVLITDVVMPGMSGIELAEQVLDRYPNAGVVMLSGYTAETLDLERVVGRGGIFLTKPVPSEDLLAAVASAAEHREPGSHPT
ncbi:MAG TPA: PAS domain S-box protein [Candidatus Limnocylindrales bacterium]